MLSMLINLSLMTPGKPLFELENTVDCAWPFSAFESAMIPAGEDARPAVAATTLSLADSFDPPSVMSLLSSLSASTKALLDQTISQTDPTFGDD
jgi:hypothetical protein